MSMVRIVTRIIPSDASPESVSRLLTPEQIDLPVRTQWNTFGTEDAFAHPHSVSDHTDSASTHNHAPGSSCSHPGNASHQLENDPVQPVNVIGYPQRGSGCPESNFGGSWGVVMAETTFCQVGTIPTNADPDSAIALRCKEIRGLMCLKKSRLRLVTESGPSERPRGAPVIKATPEVSSDGSSCSGILLSIPLRIPRSEITSPTEPPGENHAQTAVSGGAERTRIGAKSDYSRLKEKVGPLREYFKGNKCLLCGFVCASKWGLAVMRHLATHLDSQSFKCNMCDKVFQSLLHLQYHRNTHKGEQKKFTCDQCGKRFQGKRRLVVHVRKAHGDEAVQCLFCESRFESGKGLKGHMAIHAGELPHACPLCGERFLTAETLRNHSMQHKKERRFDCDVCGKGFHKKTLLQDHRCVHR